ncbi:MAG: hypothetical protein HY854_11885 [Burkholderiales bacterium]|nr:hypothetical protein [Burkholderiales bacterium]
MNDQSGPGGRPYEGADASWTNETLPLGVRRELLDRELQNLVARKKQRGQASSSNSPTSRMDGNSGGHPVADSPPPDEHAG